MKTLTFAHENIYDAVKTAVLALGGTKVIGPELYRGKDVNDAANLLSCCLNTNRSEKLSLEHFLWIMTEAQKIGMHAIPDFIGRQCGYKFEPIEHIDEMAELMKRFNESVAIQASIVERLEALKK